MTLINVNSVLAYVNHGRWVGDCGRPFCNNAMALTPNKPIFACQGPEGCGWHGQIVWPAKALEIWDALMQRPVKSTRNWFPIGHPIAERLGLPMDQTPQQLINEQKEMESLG